MAERSRLKRFTIVASVGLVLTVSLSGCGSGQPSGSAAPSDYPALEKADNALGRALRDAGPAQSQLTAQRFAALAKTTRGFTSAARAETARRVRREIRADRRTAAAAGAAMREANRAARVLAPVSLGTQRGSHFPPEALAYALFTTASDEAAYWEGLAKEARLSEGIAPAFTAEARVERNWAHRFKSHAFASTKAAKAALYRDVDKALAPAERLTGRNYALQPRTRRASRELSRDLFTLRVELRNDAEARRTAMRLVQSDPKGFLAQSLGSAS